LLLVNLVREFQARFVALRGVERFVVREDETEIHSSSKDAMAVTAGSWMVDGGEWVWWGRWGRCSLQLHRCQVCLWELR